MAKEKEEIGVEIPIGTRRAEPGIDKYAHLSDEEMADILSGDKPDPTIEKEEEPVEDDPFEDKPEADDDDKDDDKVEDDADDDADADDADADDDKDEDGDKDDADEPDEKADDENPLAKRLALLERRLELEGLERVRESEARKRAELLASKQAGRAGYLQQQLKEKAKAQPAKSEDADASDDPWKDDDSQSPAVEEDAPQPQTLQGMADEEARLELAKMAINDEGTRFANEHAGALEGMPEKFILRLQELMAEEAAPYAEEFKSGSLKAVRKLARSCMTSALAGARIEFADTLKQEATTRKADSVEKSRRRKKKAAISATGKRSAPPKPKSTSYEDMSIEELEAEMQKEFGDNYRLGAKRRM